MPTTAAPLSTWRLVTGFFRKSRGSLSGALTSAPPLPRIRSSPRCWLDKSALENRRLRLFAQEPEEHIRWPPPSESYAVSRPSVTSPRRILSQIRDTFCRRDQSGWAGRRRPRVDRAMTGNLASRGRGGLLHRARVARAAGRRRGETGRPTLRPDAGWRRRPLERAHAVPRATAIHETKEPDANRCAGRHRDRRRGPSPPAGSGRPARVLGPAVGRRRDRRAPAGRGRRHLRLDEDRARRPACGARSSARISLGDGPRQHRSGSGTRPQRDRLQCALVRDRLGGRARPRPDARGDPQDPRGRPAPAAHAPERLAAVPGKPAPREDARGRRHGRDRPASGPAGPLSRHAASGPRPAAF